MIDFLIPLNLENLNAEFGADCCSVAGEVFVIETKLDDLNRDLKKLKHSFQCNMLLDIFCTDLREVKGQNHVENFSLNYLTLSMEFSKRVLLKVIVNDIEDIVVPTIRNIWPNSEVYENEVYDMFGVTFSASTSRILNHDGFSGAPMLKDYSLTDSWKLTDSLEMPFSTNRETIDNNRIRLNIGPNHLATNNSFRLMLELESEKVKNISTEIGYIHKGIEKLVEQMPYEHISLVLSKFDNSQLYTHSIAWVKSVEEAIGLDISDRVKAIRMLFLELGRIYSHLDCIIRILTQLEANYYIAKLTEIKKSILNLSKSYFGKNISRNKFIIGGVVSDIPRGWISSSLTFISNITKSVNEICSVFLKDRAWMDRSLIGSISSFEAVNWGISGPNLRASGVNYDLRKISPYYFYDDVKFNVPLGVFGTSYDRYIVRFREIQESLKIINQILDNMPVGEFQKDVGLYKEKDFNDLLSYKLNEGDYYSFIETAHGELGYYIHSNEEFCPYRVRLRSSSLPTMQFFNTFAKEKELSDALVGLASLNISVAEVDR